MDRIIDNSQRSQHRWPRLPQALRACLIDMLDGALLALLVCLPVLIVLEVGR
jgi:hypothetical protein